jgi:thioredoxin-related protein
MKHWMLFLFTALISFTSFAQVDSTTPPYLKHPVVPPIQLLLSDSTTTYTKANLPGKTPVLLMLFSPECSHCQHETEELIAHIDELKNIQIVMATLHPISRMKEFISQYKLDEQKNIVVGKDIYYILPSFYMIHNLPYMALYDKKGRLIKAAEGSFGIQNVIDIFKANQ